VKQTPDSRGPARLGPLPQNSIFSAQNLSKTFCNLLRASWRRHRASWSFPRTFLDSAPDSGLPGLEPCPPWPPPQNWSPAISSSIIEKEIIINNHKPKSFLSLVEHPLKDSAWFTKSKNSQCEADSRFPGPCPPWPPLSQNSLVSAQNLSKTFCNLP